MALAALNSKTFFAALVLSLLISCPVISYGSQRADVTQAETMLDLLRSSVCGQVDPSIIEAVLNAHGTGLIISQQNISRTVTREQYKTLLSALSCEQWPDIAPVDASERARRGIEGLRKDVWSALRWGKTNTNLLTERIEALR